MNLSTVIKGERFRFADLREVFAKANEEKSGDQLAMIAAHRPSASEWPRSAFWPI